jgi:transposase InsO family protein
MANENPLWGEERIANELLLKVGIRISPRTVRKYMPKRPRGQPRGDQRWSTFLQNHAAAILGCDFFVAVTVTFRTLYVFVVIEHGTRRLAHLNVTSHQSAQWTLQQLREVLGESGDHEYLIHDRDAIYARHLDSSIRALGLEVLRSPIASPKANAICERLIGTIRRECLDWMIPLSEAHLRSILRTWRNHYNTGRPHSALGPGIPDPPAGICLHPDVSNPASNVGACARARQVGAGRFASRVRARADAGERVVGQPPSWRRQNGAADCLAKTLSFCRTDFLRTTGSRDVIPPARVRPPLSGPFLVTLYGSERPPCGDDVGTVDVR